MRLPQMSEGWACVGLVLPTLLAIAASTGPAGPLSFAL